MMSDHRSVPRDLVEQISRTLSPLELRCLHGSSRTFGHQPTSNLVTALLLRLPASDCCQADLITARLPHIATLSVLGSRLSGQLQQSSSCASLPVLVRRICPAMVGLKTLILCDIGMGALAAAMPHIVAACPKLTCLKLLDVESDVPRAVQPGAHGLACTLRALAALPALRRLKLSLPDDNAEGFLSLDGVGALDQLDSLSLAGYRFELPLDDLSRLVGLRKLTLENVTLRPSRAPDEALHLRALTRLRHVKLVHVEFAYYNIEALTALAACSGLASVLVTGLDGEEVDGCEGQDFDEAQESEFDEDFGRWWQSRQHHFSHLTRIECNATVALACDDLVAMPALRVLHCGSIILPLLNSPVILPHIQAVKCTYLSGEFDGAHDTWPPVQALALTFPRLAAWVYLGATVALDELLPLTPDGRLTRLRHVSACHPSAEFCGRLTGPVEELVLGEIPAHCLGPGRRTMWEAATPLPAIISSMTAVGATLRRVGLSHLSVDDACLEALADVWPLTEEVALWGEAAGPHTHPVTDAGLAALTRLKGLRRVTLIRCSAVTPRGISTLMAQLSVEYVEVCGCDQVGSADVAALHNAPSSDGVCYGLRPSLHLKHLEVEGKAGPWWGADEL